MDRPTLFHASMVVYGLAIGLDTLVQGYLLGVTPVRAVVVVASAFVLVSGAYGLSEPERTSDLSDSWLAYLMAAGAALVVGSVALTYL
ncbi:MAG: hypothetical protein ABEJ30_09575 [Halorientalis sp.]